jgi:hypothetical protein
MAERVQIVVGIGVFVVSAPMVELPRKLVGEFQHCHRTVVDLVGRRSCLEVEKVGVDPKLMI